MSRFDEEPDGDPHGECALEIASLQSENARLRGELELIRAALTGDDYASLPSDLPTVRMAHTIRADHDKFRNQVRDTCHRAEQAEARALANEKDAWRYRFLRSESTTSAQIQVMNDETQPPYFTLKSGEELDAAIDAAIAQKEGK